MGECDCAATRSVVDIPETVKVAGIVSDSDPRTWIYLSARDAEAL
jgi:hypothetical protein